MKKKLLAVCLSVAIATGLIACGANNKKETESTSKPAYVYVPEYFDWGVEMPSNGYLNTYGMTNGNVIGMAQKWDSEGASVQTILKYNIADSTVTEIPYLPEEPNEYIHSIQINSDGVMSACTELYTWDETTQEGTSSYKMFNLDDSGQISNVTSLDEVYKEFTEKYGYGYFGNFAVDADGVVYLTIEQEVVAVNPDGTKLFSIEISDYIQSMGVMPDGSVYIVYYAGMNNELAVIDKATKSIGTKYNLGSYNINGFFNITEDNTIYFNDNSAVYKMPLETGVAEKVFTWLSVDINGQYVNGVNYIDENTIFASYNDWSTNEEGFIKVVKKDSNLVTMKETLTMASLTSNQNLQRDIVAFNKANDEYHIDLKVYLDYDTMSPEDWDNYQQFMSDAQTRMLNDLTGDNPPDIIVTSNSSVSVATLAKKGLLDELTPYLEKAGYSEADFVDGVVNAYKINGKLYNLPGRFHIATLLADSAIVGDEKGWTLQEALEVIKNLPDGVAFSDNDTREYFIQKSLMYGYTTFVDEEKATCNFDSDEFKAILEMAKTFPAEYTWDEDRPSTPVLLSSGEVLTMETSFSSLEDIQTAFAYFGNKKPTFIGFPGAVGNGSLISGNSSEYAICSKSKHKDVVAEFIVGELTKAYDPEDWSSYGFPSLKSALDAQIKDELTIKYILDENGDPILDADGNPIPEKGGGGMSWGDWEYRYRPCTQEDADILLDLVEGVEGTYMNSNNTIFTMIMEEVEPFLNGQKTADDVAKIIQNRISLYLIENM